MVKKLIIVFSVFFCSVMTFEYASACTTLSMKNKDGGLYLAKNLDYAAGTAHVSIN